MRDVTTKCHKSRVRSKKPNRHRVMQWQLMLRMSLLILCNITRKPIATRPATQ